MSVLPLNILDDTVSRTLMDRLTKEQRRRLRETSHDGKIVHTTRAAAERHRDRHQYDLEAEGHAALLAVYLCPISGGHWHVGKRTIHYHKEKLS